ncbi:BTB/POZ domain-containing protein At1g21780-like [Zingiber officinale]|uniref:BTB/POZ domain-containing protein At1g21780-like n=1 Tax=Zingiber officinale TaxID=94328 RepID=UPI001C4A77A8|nr:BTB/POZ domain-containing protein At1g21780-like [Zingiber officinale]
MNTGAANSSDSKVETISRLAQWRIESFGPCSYRRSESFKLGIWNWYLTIEKSRYMYIRLFPIPCRVLKEQPPVARFVVRVSSPGPNCQCFVSSVMDRLLQTSEDFVWPVDYIFQGRFTIDVEFLSLNGGDPYPLWCTEGLLKSVSSKTSLQCLSPMLQDGIHADVTIKTSNGFLKAHKAILASSSPLFESMFLHDLREKESSTIEIEDMSLEACSALLGFIYGAIEQEEFWKH